MMVRPRAAISQMLAMLTPRISALKNALRSNEPKNDPKAIFAPPQQHRRPPGPSPQLSAGRPAITAPRIEPGAVIADLGLRHRRTRSPQMTLLRVLPSGASRPVAVHFPRSG